jgi:hypothetical protein
LALKLAKESTASMTPQLVTFFKKASGSSHLLPKLLARSVSVSLVCGVGGAGSGFGRAVGAGRGREGAKRRVDGLGRLDQTDWISIEWGVVIG